MPSLKLLRLYAQRILHCNIDIADDQQDTFISIEAACAQFPQLDDKDSQWNIFAAFCLEADEKEAELVYTKGQLESTKGQLESAKGQLVYTEAQLLAMRTSAGASSYKDHTVTSLNIDLVLQEVSIDVTVKWKQCLSILSEAQWRPDRLYDERFVQALFDDMMPEITPNELKYYPDPFVHVVNDVYHGHARVDVAWAKSLVPQITFCTACVVGELERDFNDPSKLREGRGQARAYAAKVATIGQRDFCHYFYSDLRAIYFGVVVKPFGFQETGRLVMFEETALDLPSKGFTYLFNLLRQDHMNSVACPLGGYSVCGSGKQGNILYIANEENKLCIAKKFHEEDTRSRDEFAVLRCLKRLIETQQHDGNIWHIMKYEGVELSEAVWRVADWGSIVPCILEVHRKGYIHGDICPQNIVVTVGSNQGSLRVIDFDHSVPSERPLETPLCRNASRFFFQYDGGKVNEVQFEVVLSQRADFMAALRTCSYVSLTSAERKNLKQLLPAGIARFGEKMEEMIEFFGNVVSKEAPRLTCEALTRFAGLEGMESMRAILLQL